jgi:hypothetical protein
MGSELVDIPTHYSIATNSSVSGSLDVGLDEIRLKELAPINVNANIGKLSLEGNGTLGLNVTASVKDIPPLRVEASVLELPVIRTDSRLDAGLNDIRIRELPKLQLELGVKPMCVSFPFNYHFGISIFGCQLFKFSFCGESRLVVQDECTEPMPECPEPKQHK